MEVSGAQHTATILTITISAQLESTGDAGASLLAFSYALALVRTYCLPRARA